MEELAGKICSLPPGTPRAWGVALWGGRLCKIILGHHFWQIEQHNPMFQLLEMDP